jgi:UPF0755 protein
MRKTIAPLLTILVLIIVAIAAILTVRSFGQAPSDSPQGKYEFEVKKGDVLVTVAEQLYKDKVVSSPYSLRIESISTPVEDLQIGIYVLDVPADAKSVINQINEQSKEKKQFNLNSSVVPTKKVTIREGLTLDEVIALLVKEGVATQVDLQTTANSPDLFRAKYEFLPQPLPCIYADLSTCAKYYLEGYLYPDTYTFVLGGSAQSVYEQMLNNFDKKVYSNVKGELTNDKLYQTIILASVIERETGRTKGVNEATAGELAQERSIMAGVFANRIKQGIKWQSDPTVTYGTDLKVCQQTFELKGCVFLDDSRVNTLYNTYRIEGYPIGPTTSPQWEVIKAVLNPIDNNYIYFVSDVVGKKYFAETEAEHYNNIDFVKDLNDKLGQ